MPGLRDHEPIVLEEFNGLWDRGDADSAPLDHFIQADNIQYHHSNFETRDPLDKYQNQANALGRILRVYNYVMQTGDSLLVLVEGGDIYHVVGPAIVYGPILSIAAMVDFGFVAIAGRAYITPFASYVNARGVNEEKGLQSEFTYVYKGDGTAARKAAGFPPTNTSKKPFIAFLSSIDGIITKGVHVVAVAFNDGADGILGPEIFPVVLATGDKQIQLTNIPIGPVGTVSRIIVMTKAIDPKDYVADVSGYTFYTVLTIADNTTENIKINVKDADLVAVYVPGATAAPHTDALLVENLDDEGDYCDWGFHLIGVLYETDTGYYTAPGPEYFGAQTMVDVKRGIKVSNIPVSPDSFVTKRHLVATKWIPEYNGDQKGFQFFFIPDGNIDNNVDTTKEVSFYDSDLVSDASHLIDNFSEIPAFVGLNTYHGRMVGWAEYDNVSVARISAEGEPEAISQVDGLIIAPLDGNPITNGQEFRDILYLFKRDRTYAYPDSGDVPSSWKLQVIDEGLGASVHGIGTVLDSGGVNIDFLIITNFSGIFLFNGTFARPELSWKIYDFWKTLDRNKYRSIQIADDTLNQKCWITLPEPIEHKMIYFDFKNGLDAQHVRFAIWIFDAKIKTITLTEIDTLIIGALEPV